MKTVEELLDHEAECPFTVGEDSEAVWLVQAIVGQEPTGVWTEENTEAYLNQQLKNAWYVLLRLPHLLLPKNWLLIPAINPDNLRTPPSVPGY